MDQVSLVKKQFRMEQWKQRILECQASGMTVRSWCRQQGVAEQNLLQIPQNSPPGIVRSSTRFSTGNS